MMKSHVKSGACFMERREDVHLCRSILGNRCLEELKEIDKHEIIAKICDIIGPHPENFSIAEEIFEKVKFDIARYIMHHEYCRENTIRRRLLIWLDSKVNPSQEAVLTDFMHKYFKK